MAPPPDGQTSPAATATLAERPGGDGDAFRTDRADLLCFAAEDATEAALRAGFAQAGLEAVCQRAPIARATEALRGMPTPWTLVVDVSGDPDPLAALDDLSGAVEPDVQVLVVGEREDVGFYRHLTRGLGVADYLFKPLTPAMVAEHFAPIAARRRGGAGPARGAMARGGRLVTVTGARGGVGASTVAACLAWHLANAAQRHTAVLDADLHRGTLGLLLGAAAQPGAGLRQALESPDRVDALFVERAAPAVAERLRLLAAEEPLTQGLAYAPGAAARLIGQLRRRHNLIVADVPFNAGPLARDLLDLAQQRVIVLDPTLSALRDALRLMQLPPGPGQAHRPILVLNRAGRGRRRGLPTDQVTETLGTAPDIVIPDLGRGPEAAATIGDPKAAARPFRAAMEKLALEAAGIVAARPAPRRRGLLGGLFRR